MPPIPITTLVRTDSSQGGRAQEENQVQPGFLKKNWWILLALGAAAFWLWRKK